jgi:hypothetical protein
VVDQPGAATRCGLDEVADTIIGGARPARRETDAPHRLDLAAVVEQDGDQIDLELVCDLLRRQLGNVPFVQPLGRPVQDAEQLLDRGGDLVEVGDPAGRPASV